MRKPPPIPMLCGLKTPLQNRVAIAASTAVPSLFNTSLEEKMFCCVKEFKELLFLILRQPLFSDRRTLSEKLISGLS